MSEDLKTYLFLPQGGENQKLTDSYIAVKQANINHTIAQKTEKVNNYGILFTTTLDWKEVNKRLDMKKDETYMLIELTGNITSETIAGFFPDTDIDELKSLNLENLKDSAKWLEEELKKAVDNEDYEKAQEIKNKLDKKNGDSKDN